MGILLWMLVEIIYLAIGINIAKMSVEMAKQCIQTGNISIKPSITQFAFFPLSWFDRHFIIDSPAYTCNLSIYITFMTLFWPLKFVWIIFVCFGLLVTLLITMLVMPIKRIFKNIVS